MFLICTRVSQFVWVDIMKAVSAVGRMLSGSVASRRCELGVHGDNLSVSQRTADERDTASGNNVNVRWHVDGEVVLYDGADAAAEIGRKGQNLKARRRLMCVWSDVFQVQAADPIFCQCAWVHGRCCQACCSLGGSDGVAWSAGGTLPEGGNGRLGFGLPSWSSWSLAQCLVRYLPGGC